MGNNDLSIKGDSHHFRVAIFGSSRIEKDDPIYQNIYMLAKKIAAENIDVVTGGGPGLMNAANKGHIDGRKDNSCYSMGLNIRIPLEQEPNKHLDIIKEFDIFSNRLDKFMMLSNVLVVAPGGIGTSLELFYAWQLIQVKHIGIMPIILLGDMWKALMQWIKEHPLKNKLLDEEDLVNIFTVNTIDEAMEIINMFYREFKKGNDYRCENFEKYSARVNRGKNL